MLITYAAALLETVSKSLRCSACHARRLEPRDCHRPARARSERAQPRLERESRLADLRVPKKDAVFFIKHVSRGGGAAGTIGFQN